MEYDLPPLTVKTEGGYILLEQTFLCRHNIIHLVPEQIEILKHWLDAIIKDIINNPDE